MQKLTRQELHAFFDIIAGSFPHDECLTCECFLGFVTRLRMDSGKSGYDLISKYQIEKNHMHSCLGCDPCPPGNMYADYVRKKSSQPLITL